MLVLDMPLIPAQDTPMVLQTSAGARKSTNTGDIKTLFATVGGCVVSPTFERLEQQKQTEYSVFSEGMPLWPDADAVQLFGDIRMDVRMMEAYDAAQSYILQQPRHGTLETVKASGHPDQFKYVPSPGFVGNDRAVFLVNIDGHDIKVIQYIKVVRDPKLLRSPANSA